MATQTVPSPIHPAKLLGANGFKYRPQYGVIVVCETEAHQISVFNQLKAAGHKTRVVCV
jgi:hypothetical protein